MKIKTIFMKTKFINSYSTSHFWLKRSEVEYWMKKTENVPYGGRSQQSATADWALRGELLPTPLSHFFKYILHVKIHFQNNHDFSEFGIDTENFRHLLHKLTRISEPQKFEKLVNEKGNLSRNDGRIFKIM